MCEATPRQGNAGLWSNASVAVTNALDQSGITLANDYTRKEFTVPAIGSLFYRVESVTVP